MAKKRLTNDKKTQKNNKNNTKNKHIPFSRTEIRSINERKKPKNFLSKFFSKKKEKNNTTNGNTTSIIPVINDDTVKEIAKQKTKITRKELKQIKQDVLQKTLKEKPDSGLKKQTKAMHYFFRSIFHEILHLSKKQIILISSFCVIIFIAIISFVLMHGFNKSNVSETTPNEIITTYSPGEKGATDDIVGKTFKNGGFEIKILSYESEITLLGETNRYVPQKGQFVVINVKITNINSENPGDLIIQNQKLKTNSGKRYSTNVDLAALLNKTNVFGTKNITKGTSQTGYLVYDIPKNNYGIALNFESSIHIKPTVIPLG
jgi:hypothetical protein